MKSMNDFRRKINLYFDNELDNSAKNELMNIIDQDPSCSKIFNKEKMFRDFIQHNVKRPSVSPEFIQNLKSRIDTH